MKEQKITEDAGISIICKVWKDNEAALRHAVIECHPIHTKVQKADIMTKELAVKDFENKRRMIMRW